MKVLVKTLKGDQFEIEASDDGKVSDLKQKIGEKQGFENPLECKVIFSGKVLGDDSGLTEVGLKKEGSFVVVMPPKKGGKPAATPTAESKKPSAEKSTSDETEPRTPAKVEDKPAPSTPAAPTKKSEKSEENKATEGSAAASEEPGSSSATPDASGASTLLSPAECEATIKKICEMGFEEKTVEKAMRAAFNNPERAVEYLFNGIPEAAEPAAAPAGLAMPAGADVAPQPAESGGTETGTAAEGAAPRDNEPFNMFEPQAGGNGARGGSSNLDFLRNLPQLNMLKYVAQRRPELLEEMFHQIGRSNPQIVNLINTNQTEFVRLLHEPIPPQEQVAFEATMESMIQGGEPRGAGAGEAGGEGQRPQQTVIQISQDEQAQIERLEAIVGPMGLDRREVFETWLACDRNEQLAANFLLNAIEEHDMPQETEEGGDDAAS